MNLPKDFMTNREKYPDDFKVTIGDVETSYGDLRAYLEQQNESVAAALQQQRADLEARQAQLAAQAEDLATLQGQLQEAAGRTQGNEDIVETLINRLRGPGKKTLMDLQDDEFFGAAVKAVRELREQLAAEAAERKRLETEATNLVKWMTQREVERDWDSLPNKPKNLTKQQLVKLAQDRKYVDDVGYPDLRRAYDEVTAPDRSKEERARIKQEAKAELEKEQAEARAKKPTSRQDAIDTRGHVFVPNGSSKGNAPPPPKQGGFGGVDRVPTETILNDPDIAGLFENS